MEISTVIESQRKRRWWPNQHSFFFFFYVGHQSLFFGLPSLCCSLRLKVNCGIIFFSSWCSTNSSIGGFVIDHPSWVSAKSRALFLPSSEPLFHNHRCVFLASFAIAFVPQSSVQELRPRIHLRLATIGAPWSQSCDATVLRHSDFTLC